MDNRRNAVKKMIGLAVGIPASPFVLNAATVGTANTLNTNPIRHSVCKWCYNDVPLDEFCEKVKSIGITSVELMGPKEWPILKKHGIDCAMPNGAGLGIEKGFNDPKYHAELIKSYKEVIPKVAEAGYKSLICFSGNRNGLSDEVGLENCVKGLKELTPIAEKYDVTLIMELLNSRVDHKDYMCDTSAWGFELCKRLNSNHFKMLFDIYHMQIMEGDIIRTIKKNIQYIGHFHTGGNPGRNEIDETQELYYPAIMKAISESGYKGYVGQEFIPKRNWFESLKQSIEICTV